MVEKKTYAELIYEKYKGKTVEIYIGDDTGTILYSDYDIAQKSVIQGVVRNASGDMLTLQCNIKTQMNNHVCEVDINGWCIKGITEQRNEGIGILTVFGNDKIKHRKR